jgi:hypothetical protein
MNTEKLMNEILAFLQTIRNDKNKLENLHQFMVDEIYEEPEPEEIPEKYNKAVYKITDSILAGLICYFNPDTLEVEDIPEIMVQDPEEYESMTGEPVDSLELEHINWTNCIEIEPMESHESFKIMEYFIDEVKDKNLQQKLISALSRKKPFANFKYLVENSDYRQQWFDFRQKQWAHYVWNAINPNTDL